MKGQQSFGAKKGSSYANDIITGGGAGEVDHLNKMLNNINVQTKKNELGETLGKLPRKINFNLFYFSNQETLKNYSFIFYIFNFK